MSQTESAAMVAAAEAMGLACSDGPFIWSEAAKVAAMCLAGVLMPPGETTPHKVAIAVGRGTTAQDVRRWRTHPEFAAAVNMMVIESSQKLYEQGMAIKANRVTALQKRHTALMAVMEAREEWAALMAPDDIVADAYATDADGDDGAAFHLPGIGTGAMKLVRKSVGSGNMQRIVLEAEFDNALFLELRRIEEQIARELGQWQPDTAASVNIKLYAGIDLSQV